MAKVTPEMFASDTPPTRIVGVECEYHIEHGTGAQSPSGFINEDAMRAAGFASVGQFMDNGSRLYPDISRYIEYCTPESYGPYAAADADMDGIGTVSEIVNASGLEQRGLYRIGGTTLTNDPDKKSHYTNGVHENYMFPAKLVHDDRLRGLLASHLASRLWAMNGNVYDGKYEFSQKVNGIGGGSSGGDPIVAGIARRTDAGGKPMALLLAADSDTMGSDDWARGEVRYADPQLSRRARRISLAATSLVFRLAEQQHRFEGPAAAEFDDMILKDPYQAAHGYATDVSLTRAFEVRSGRQRTAMDIQKALVGKLWQLVDAVELPADELDGLARWSQAIDAIRRSRPAEADYDPYLLDTFDVLPSTRCLCGRIRSETTR